MLWLIDIEVAITHTKPFYGDRLVYQHKIRTHAYNVKAYRNENEKI